jgi:hypothetical protein
MRSKADLDRKYARNWTPLGQNFWVMLLDYLDIIGFEQGVGIRGFRSDKIKALPPSLKP